MCQELLPRATSHPLFAVAASVLFVTGSFAVASAVLAAFVSTAEQLHDCRAELQVCLYCRCRACTTLLPPT